MQVGAVLPRFLVVYAALYAGYGLTTPFLPALLSERGLSPTEVGEAPAGRCSPPAPPSRG